MIWRIRFSHNMPRRMNDSFDFPGRNGSVHYITKHQVPIITGTIIMKGEIQASLDAKFDHLDKSGNCPTPPNFRLYFDTGDMYNQFGRWWSNPASIVLASGEFSLEVPLTPEFWSSVLGKFGDRNRRSLKAFNRALRTVRNVGFTFGGGCNFGHGVRVRKGNARFMLNAYSITEVTLT